ncbi:MAG: hypothetical protein NTW28_35690, partial [Candidatus Solibacter sp.]|nr:hypothetical protein [Candidatus Solibacter sp.]
AGGRRGEVENAIAWRQAKGTLECVGAIARTIASTAAEVQEGWKRVILTARIGQPVLSAIAYGEDADIPLGTPDADVDMAAAATHPGLPMGTVDFRIRSRAVQTLATNAVARPSSAGEVAFSWRTANPHGNPCQPGGFDDRSARTVDLRTPSWNSGHFHPKRLLLFMAPPRGKYFAGQQTLAWADIHAAASHALIRIDASADTVRYEGLTDGPLRITGAVALDDGRTHIFENLAFAGVVTAACGAVTARNAGFVELTGSAANVDAPVVDLSNALIGSLSVPKGLARMAGCTVLTKLTATCLQATDCILPGQPDQADMSDQVVLPLDAGAKASCLRFSRVPWTTSPAPASVLLLRCSAAAPAYLDDGTVTGVALPSMGILHASSSGAIVTGAEDGGEMGTGHAGNHRGRIAALVAKLGEFLPVGIEAAVVIDSRMALVPPRVKI